MTDRAKDTPKDRQTESWKSFTFNETIYTAFKEVQAKEFIELRVGIYYWVAMKN